MLWIGTELGRLEQLSLASFLAAGHEVRLHVYDTVRNVPQAIRLADASDLMPFETAQALKHRKTASFALASDYFRFMLQKQSLGLWADSDVVCLSPIATEDPVLFGWESEDYINGAVLYIAAGNPLVDAALAAFAERTIPPWVPTRKALPFHIKRWFGGSFGPADLPRGTYGPKCLTALAKDHDLLRLAKPTDVFYPLHPRQARRIFEPGTSVEQIITENSLTIHLWNEKLGALKKANPPSSSAIAALMRRFGV